MKPALTLFEQCQLLMDRGLEVANRDDFSDFLASQNYYRLRGYFHPFLVDYDGTSSDHFKAGTSSKTIEELVEFDRRLRVLLYESLAIFETRFRASVAYHGGHKDAFIHLSGIGLTPEFTNNLVSHETSAHQNWLVDYERMLDQQKATEFIEWHLKSRQGRLPIWAAVEMLEFGKVSKLYRGFEEDVATPVAEDFNSLPMFLKGAVASLNDLRNNVAHHSRIWNLHFPVNPLTRISKLPDGLKHIGEQSNYNQHKIFTRLSLLLWFDSQKSFEINLKVRLFELLEQLPKSTAILYSSMGYTAAFEKSDLWVGFVPRN